VVGPGAAVTAAETTLAMRATGPVTVQPRRYVPPGSAGRHGDSDRDEEGIGRLSELDMETPEGDAVEQRQEVVEDENGGGQRREIPFDVDEADAAEQRREVRIDDDDYR
jgi:hypothetical protein